MWWRKEKARPPFTGSSFDAALHWCQANGERIEIRSADAFDVFLGARVVHVERFVDDDWLHAWAILPDPPLDLSERLSFVKSSEKFAVRQFEQPDTVMSLLSDGNIRIRFLKLMKFQGEPRLMVFNMLSTFDFLLNSDESRLYPSDSIYFYLKGGKFEQASRAAIDYFRGRGIRQVEENDHYISFDTGGLCCVVPLGGLEHEFSFRYAFSDLMLPYRETKSAFSTQILNTAYRKMNPKIMCYTFSDGVSEMAISGVLTEGTEALPIFDRTLAELTQVVLDSMELIKMNPGLVKGTQFLTSEEEAIELASKYHGAKTGGAEHLVE